MSKRETEAVLQRTQAERAALEAQLKAARESAFLAEAKAFIAVNQNRVLPAEHNNLIAQYVQAKLDDELLPLEGTSRLDQFKAAIEGREEHWLFREVIPSEGASTLRST